MSPTKLQMSSGAEQSGSTSIEKALAVLEAFDVPQRSLGIGDLVGQLGLPRPTVHRILTQLANAGFVRRLPSRRYQIGLRVFELGSLVADQVQLRIPAIPHLHALYELTDAAVYLSVWAGNEVLHLDCLPSRSEPPLPARAGGRWTAHCASVGKVLLAHASPEVLQQYLRKPLRAVTRHTITERTEFVAHLDQVRKQGYATTVEESLPGIYGLAAPIRDRDNRVVAAVCIAGRNRLLLNRRAEVIETASAISRDIARSVPVRSSSAPLP